MIAPATHRVVAATLKGVTFSLIMKIEKTKTMTGAVWYSAVLAATVVCSSEMYLHRTWNSPHAQPANAL
jgi:hypothetical protein